MNFAALHGGKNTAGGHYVCHVKKEGQWCIFNDEKVAECMPSRPPARANARDSTHVLW
jgi:ubiquitin C-terminal hydrolase